MDITLFATFTLQNIIKHGDSVQSDQASRMLQDLQSTGITGFVDESTKASVDVVPSSTKPLTGVDSFA